MRLRRLDLTRYGKFTEFSLDFGEARPQEPDFHIVYGANEAGKSTCFSAWLDLLYGIEPRSRYNFLHNYSAMQIGARIETADGSSDLVRVKRNQNSLSGPDGRAVAETVALAELGGIDRDAYRSMFSLDEDSLEEGGETILASKGELGELLFSASAGLADLSRALVKIREDADGFYRYRARNTELSSLKDRLGGSQAEAGSHGHCGFGICAAGRGSRRGARAV